LPERELIISYSGSNAFDLTYVLKFKPAMMTKLVQGAPLQVDLSANPVLTINSPLVPFIVEWR
jgi:hypothetical protein